MATIMVTILKYTENDIAFFYGEVSISSKKYLHIMFTCFLPHIMMTADVLAYTRRYQSIYKEDYLVHIPSQKF